MLLTETLRPMQLARTATAATVYGLDGNDTLMQACGRDATLVGGNGDDHYIISS